MELTDLCKAKDCAHEQRLLRNMNAHEVVLELLQIPYNHKVIYNLYEKIGTLSRGLVIRIWRL